MHCIMHYAAVQNENQYSSFISGVSRSELRKDGKLVQCNAMQCNAMHCEVYSEVSVIIKGQLSGSVDYSGVQ